MSAFFLTLALGIGIGYCIANPEMVKGWIAAIRMKVGK